MSTNIDDPSDEEQLFIFETKQEAEIKIGDLGMKYRMTKTWHATSPLEKIKANKNLRYWIKELK